MDIMIDSATKEKLIGLYEAAGACGTRTLFDLNLPQNGETGTTADAERTSCDYALAGLISDALDTSDTEFLYAHILDAVRKKEKKIRTLGTRSVISLDSLRGLIPEDRLNGLKERLIERGGRMPSREKNADIDISYFTAVGCDEHKLEIARAIQLFMPGTPLIRCEDLLALVGNVDLEPIMDAETFFARPVVQRQLKMIRLRNTHPAFSDDAVITANRPTSSRMTITWRKGYVYATVSNNFVTGMLEISAS